MRELNIWSIEEAINLWKVNHQVIIGYVDKIKHPAVNFWKVKHIVIISYVDKIKHPDIGLPLVETFQKFLLIIKSNNHQIFKSNNHQIA